MTREHIAIVIDDTRLSVEELASSCAVTRQWIVQHVRAGVLLTAPDPNPERWSFSGQDLLRARRLLRLERDFEANPELAGLVADLFDELDRLRARLRREGLSPD